MSTRVLLRPVTFAGRVSLIQENLEMLQANIVETQTKGLSPDAVILVQIVMKQLHHMEQMALTRLEIHSLFRLQKRLTEMLAQNVYTNRAQNDPESSTV